MSSLNRTITGDVLVQQLSKDAQTIDASLLTQHGRSGRTLVKDGPLRLTITALSAGSELPVHSADGPMTVHVLEGDARFHAANRDYDLRTGDVLVLAAGVQHSAKSSGGAVFLLTVVHLPSAGTPE